MESHDRGEIAGDTDSEKQQLTVKDKLLNASGVVGEIHSSNTRVMHWVCSRESHRNGGFHFHMALKLDRCRHWLCSKKFLKEQHSISVHFSDLHYNYYSAWKYVTKEDEHVVESNDHPDLWNSKAPKTGTACSVRKKKPRFARER